MWPSQVQGAGLTQPRGALETLKTKLNNWNMEHLPLKIAGVEVFMDCKDHSHLRNHSIYLVAQARTGLKVIQTLSSLSPFPYRQSVPIPVSSPFYK